MFWVLIKTRDFGTPYSNVNNFSVESVRIDFRRERLSSEKRKHKESVKEYFDRYKQLPMDFNNSDFGSNQVPKQQPLLVKASLTFVPNSIFE